MCIVEYDQPLSAERAVLNAGAFDGFMFDVTRTKTQMYDFIIQLFYINYLKKKFNFTEFFL